MLLSGAQNVEPRPGELPGYDMAASSVLKSAFVLAGRWRGADKLLLASETLLVALIETLPQLAENDAAPVWAALRDMTWQPERYRLLGMSAAVGASPRRANRFANLYRLLKASLSPAERRGFVLDGGKGGSYGGALTLLAAATGAPQATRVLVAQLAEEPGADPASYLQTRFAAVAPSVLPSEKPAFDAVQAMALAAQDTAAAVRHLRHWAPRVNRFVFDGQD